MGTHQLHFTSGISGLKLALMSIWQRALSRSLESKNVPTTWKP